jgi:hypothetical protein
MVYPMPDQEFILALYPIRASHRAAVCQHVSTNPLYSHIEFAPGNPWLLRQFFGFPKGLFGQRNGYFYSQSMKVLYRFVNQWYIQK